MATRDKKRYQRDPSEAQLRVMLEARQHELEAQRQRTSRTFSTILLGAIFLVAGAIWLFPSAPAVTDQAASAVALSPDVQPSTAGDSDLKSFTDVSSSADSTEDVRFAMQLLNFVNPGASPAANAKIESAAKAISEGSLQKGTGKVSSAMP